MLKAFSEINYSVKAMCNISFQYKNSIRGGMGKLFYFGRDMFHDVRHCATKKITELVNIIRDRAIAFLVGYSRESGSVNSSFLGKLPKCNSLTGFILVISHKLSETIS